MSPHLEPLLVELLIALSNLFTEFPQRHVLRWVPASQAVADCVRLVVGFAGVCPFDPHFGYPMEVSEERFGAH